MTTATFALSLLLASAPQAREAVDCARELADARRLYEDQSAERLAFAAPLVRAVRAIVDHTLTDEDRALVRGFKDGTVAAAELDARLWPRLRRAFARFNAVACRNLGGVAGADELVDGLTTLGGGAGLHTGVVVACAQRIPGLEGRRYVGLRVRADADGPALVLQGVIERAELALVAAGERRPARRLALQLPLGDRAMEAAALDAALAELTGREADFTWTVPAACRSRVSTAALSNP